MDSKLIHIGFRGFPQLFTEWLTRHLNEMEDFCVVSSQKNQAEESTLSNESPPDVLLLFSRTANETEQVRQLHLDSRKQSIIVWCPLQGLTDVAILSLLNSGVQAILSDHHKLEDIAEAIRSCHDGTQYVNDIVGKALLHYSRKQHLSTAQATKVRSLNEREQQMVRLRKSGCTSREIAERLFLSKKTIDKQFGEMYRRFECQNFFELLSRLERISLEEPVLFSGTRR